MTDPDRMTEAELESRLRASLQRSLVPPETPASLHAAVGAMAAEHLGASAGSRPSWREALRMGASGLRVATGALAVVAVAVVALVVLGTQADHPQVGATPHPTLPAVTGPALPDPVGTPTRLAAAGWIDQQTIVAAPRDADGFRMSTDGGQTWSEPRNLPLSSSDLGFDFLDASHGDTMWIDGAPGDPRTLTVYLTGDGGRTWHTVTAGTLPAMRGTSAYGNVHFTDAVHGVALGTLRTDAVGTDAGPAVACQGFATGDGGASWSPIADAPCLWGGGVSWYTPTLGVALLPDRQVVTTEDGGRTWVHGTLPDPADRGTFWVRAGVELRPGVVNLIGLDMPAATQPPLPLVVLASDDGGATWRQARVSDAIDMLDVSNVTAFDADHWIAAARVASVDPGAEGTVFRETWDGGRSWSEAGRTAIDTGGGVSWFDRLHGTIQGSLMQGGSGQGYITVWLTNDGGQSWHEVSF